MVRQSITVCTSTTCTQTVTTSDITGKRRRQEEQRSVDGGGFKDQKTDANHFTDSLPNDYHMCKELSPPLPAHKRRNTLESHSPKLIHTTCFSQCFTHSTSDG